MDVRSKVTVKDFEAFTELSENENRSFELIHGEIVEKMPTAYHGLIVHLLGGYIFMYLQQNPIGWAMVETKCALPDDEENAYQPDLCFVRETAERKFEKVKALPYIPDLTVEVLSPKQSPRLMLDKALYYLANGGQMVWLVYPEKQIVEVITQGERQILTIEDTLEGGDVLPGLKIPVKEIFR
jgi:Uma2 family endonuclease